MPLIDHRDIARQHRTKLLQSVACAVGAGKTVAVRAAIDRAWTAPATTSSTCPTPPSACAASTTTSSPRSAGSPASTTPPWSPQAARRAGRRSTPNGAATPSCHRRGPPARHHAALEAMRLLTNHDIDTGSPFATILLGQPTLRRQDARSACWPRSTNASRVRHTMTGMTSEETAGYIRHHLQLAGRSDTLFSDDAIALIHNASRGKPRAVNNLALPRSSPPSPPTRPSSTKPAPDPPSPKPTTTTSPRHPDHRQRHPDHPAPPDTPERG